MISIFCAGVAVNVAQDVIEKFKGKYPEEEVKFQRGGSNFGINKLINGEKYDVMILADNSNIDQMMLPKYCGGYYIWGGNSMVILGDGLTEENWTEKIFEDGAVIRHMNPYDDPSGYRSVMAMKLADKYKHGLTERFFSHPGYKGLDKEQYEGPFKMLLEDKNNENAYLMMYKSLAFGQGRSFVELPPVMNLGDPKYEAEYKKVSFVIGSGEEVAGTTIYHAVLIPNASENKSSAVNFVKMFLSTDFTGYGFTDVRRAVGDFPL